MSFDQLLEDLAELLVQIRENIFAILPNLLYAVIIVLIGVLVARLLQSVVNRFINNLHRLIPGKKWQTGLKQIRPEHSGRLMGKIVYWTVIVFFLTAATEVLGLPIITSWLSGLGLYLPNILIAVVVVFLGIIGGRLLRDIITTATGTVALIYGNVLGRLAQYGIILITVMIAVEQVGINVGILTGVIDIILAAILFGAALAFGLGARTSVSNILASYYVQHRYREGQTLKIGDIQGRIIQITSTAVIIETTDGQVSVPAKKFSEDVSTMLKREESSQ